MGAELVIWFVYAALFFILFLLPLIRYRTNPKVYCQLALFNLLFAVFSALTAVGRMAHDGPASVDGYRSWLYDAPPPMQFAFPCLSVILYNGLFDAQLQFFKFYVVVLSNYGRWSALHMNPRISKLSIMDSHDGDMMHMNPVSIWRWFNIALLLIYGSTVISLVCCQFILNDSAQTMGLSLSSAICITVLSICVLLNLASSIYARYKMNLKYSLTRHAPKEERAGFKYATSTTTAALVPEDKSKRSLLILIVSPALFLASALTITLEKWISYGTLIYSTATTLSPSLSTTIVTLDLVIECLFICIPISLLVILNVFYVKPYPLIMSSHDI
ncbi:hypothetical protein BCR42DRAFT_405869 [Absidia repens]|uniref:Uncharacterized protein n=1 Tax=Absidia repens TaxID=90262 RepID=A0A1X2IU42_9FUNG|nr:hypothetical protein BCR42DRAFT_405869 [Absidia repens]